MYKLASLAIAAAFVSGCLEETQDREGTPEATSIATEDTSGTSSLEIDDSIVTVESEGLADSLGPTTVAAYQHRIDPAGCFTCADLATRAENYCNWHYGFAYSQQGTCYRSTCSTRWDHVRFNCVIWAREGSPENASTESDENALP